MANILVWVSTVSVVNSTGGSGAGDRLYLSGKVWADTDTSQTGYVWNAAYASLPYTTASEDIDEACVAAALAVASGQGFTPGAGDAVRLIGGAMSRRFA